MHSKICRKLFIKILKNCNKPILIKRELSDIVGSDKKLEELKEFFVEEINYPTQCPFKGCESRDIEYKIKNNKIIIRDLENPTHDTEESINNWISCEIKIGDLVFSLLKNIFDKIKCFEISQIEDTYRLQTIYKECEMDVIFSMSDNIKEDEFFKALSPSLIFKRPCIVITKDTEENFEVINSMCLKIPLGNFVYPFYIDDFENKNSKDDLKGWTNRIIEIKNLEDKILSDLPKERSKLVCNIDINPKYLLSVLVRLKAYKSKKGNKKYNWGEMEHIISAVFRYLYSSDIRYGGVLQPQKKVPDNIFFIKIDTKFQITGIVDAKFSFAADLSAEKTEKHEEYLKLVRNQGFAPPKIALVFPLLGTKSDTSITEFFNRLKRKMKQSEYCIILPIDALELLIYVYIGATLRGKINLSSSDFNNILEKIFDEEYLDQTSCKMDTSLYKLKSDFIFSLIKEITRETTTVEEMTAKIMKK